MIEEGMYVIVQKLGGEHMRVCKFIKKQSILVEKLKFIVDGAFGCGFGLFDVRDGSLIPANVSALIQEDLVETEGCASSNGSAAIATASVENDSALDPAQKRQKLTQEAIEGLKESGLTTDELVSKLIEGNTAFADRTTFAKDKYIRRKTRKHGDRVLLLKPTIRQVADVYYRKDAERIANLRIDQLSQILNFAGVRAGAKVLILEQCQGLVSAAVLERMNGDGMCVHVHKGMNAQAIPCLHSLNFDEKIMNAFYPLSTDFLLSKSDANSDPDKRLSDEAKQRKVARQQRDDRLFPVLNGSRIDSLILALRTISPVESLKTCFAYLAQSGPLVIYSPFVQPLIECHQWLKEQGAVNVQIVDGFYRRHQVLPDRTHPEMQQMVTGGFILTAIKVAPPK